MLRNLYGCVSRCITLQCIYTIQYFTVYMTLLIYVHRAVPPSYIILLLLYALLRRYVVGALRERFDRRPDSQVSLPDYTHTHTPSRHRIIITIIISYAMICMYVHVGILHCYTVRPYIVYTAIQWQNERYCMTNDMKHILYIYMMGCILLCTIVFMSHVFHYSMSIYNTPYCVCQISSVEFLKMLHKS